MAVLQGKCALVTGSVAGLGFAMADGLAAAGANLVLNGLCTAEEGAAAAARIQAAHGVEAVFDPADLRDVGAIEAMMQGAADRFGGVDVLVNNAVVRTFAPVDELAAKDWDDALAVNVSAAFHTVRLALPGMKANGWGRILNLSSVYGQRGDVNRVGYVVAKSALIGLTRAVALETATHGVTCNALAPGSVPTPAILGKLDAMAAAAGADRAEIERDYLLERHPTGRFVAMENVAALAVFLCGPAGADITGALLPVDGGWTAR